MENNNVAFRCFKCGELGIDCVCPNVEEDQDDKFSVDEIALAITTRKCLICQDEIDIRSHIPLCREHRLKYFGEVKKDG